MFSSDSSKLTTEEILSLVNRATSLDSSGDEIPKVLSFFKENPSNFSAVNRSVLMRDWSPKEVRKLSSWAIFICSNVQDIGDSFDEKERSEANLTRKDQDTYKVINFFMAMWNYYSVPATEWPDLFYEGVKRCRDYIVSNVKTASEYEERNHDFIDLYEKEKARLLKDPTWGPKILAREGD